MASTASSDSGSPGRRHRPLRSRLGRLFLWLLGWKIEGAMPAGQKFVIIAAPHTSNWDLPIMLAISYALDVQLSFLMKHTMFRGPFDRLFRWLGGVPVYRDGPHNLVEQCVQAFQEREELVLAVPPEGTRAKVPYWKTGFYWIAHGARVPILLGFLDFGRKVGGLGPTVVPSGDLPADLEKIRAFYAGMRGKNPRQTSQIVVHSPGEEDRP